MIELRLPWPPQANNLHTVARGRKILGLAGRAYRAQVWVAVRQQLGHPPRLAVRLRVVFHAHTPDRRRRDLSNLLKAAEDALTVAGLWLDDSQIDDLRIVRHGVTDGGRLDVLVETIVPQSNEIEGAAPWPS